MNSLELTHLLGGVGLIVVVIMGLMALVRTGLAHKMSLDSSKLIPVIGSAVLLVIGLIVVATIASWVAFWLSTP